MHDASLTSQSVRTVAFFSGTWETGGVFTVTLSLARFLHDRGIRVMLYCHTVVGSPFTPEQLATVTVRRIPEAACFDPDDSTGAWRRALAEDGVEVLISQGFSRIPFRVIKEQAGVHTVFCLHGIPFYEELLAISNEEISRRRSGGKSSLSQWWWRHHTAPHKLRRMARTHDCNRPLALALPWIDRVVCLIPDFATQLFEGMLRAGQATEADRDKFTAIINPLPEPPASVDLDAKEKLVIYCGRLCMEDKRVERLLYVWARVEPKAPGWRLALIGSGPDEAFLREEARRLGLKRVTFEGFHHDPSPYYRRAALSCLVSQYEGLGMAHTEAQQYGAVPIGFRMTALDYITEDGKAGLQVRPYSISDYASKLLYAIRHPRRLRALAERSIIASRRYSASTIGSRWLSLIDSLTHQ